MGQFDEGSWFWFNRSVGIEEKCDLAVPTFLLHNETAPQAVGSRHELQVIISGAARDRQLADRSNGLKPANCRFFKLSMSCYATEKKEKQSQICDTNRTTALPHAVLTKRDYAII